MRCAACGREVSISKSLPFCAGCIRDHFDTLGSQILDTHARVRKAYGLPEQVQVGASVRKCQLCVNKCNIEDRGYGHCGVRQHIGGKISGPNRDWAYVDWYHDALPTNCVADWVCAGSKDHGYKNLAVFYEACTFNCLFCQNWHYRDHKNRARTEDLVRAADALTRCVCFFGGDPTPFALHSLEVARQLHERKRKFRICWETNGSIAPHYMKQWVDYALASDGCIKIDFKTFSRYLNLALCGASNQNTKENIRLVAQYIEQREKPPILVVSTLLIPGYIDERELGLMAEFIGSINKDIPWSFLGFHPHFHFSDMPCTTHKHADMALAIAEHHGIRNTHLGNVHLLQ